MMPRAQSSAESHYVTGFLSKIIPGLSNDIVRKLAHVCEYAALGFLFSLHALSKHRVNIHPKHFVNILFSGLFVSVIDETIQIFSARGPEITDVWIDMAGILVAVIVALIIKSLRKA